MKLLILLVTVAALCGAEDERDFETQQTESVADTVPAGLNGLTHQGVPYDTPAVQAAREAHLAALAKAHAKNPPKHNDGYEEYSHRPAPPPARYPAHQVEQVHYARPVVPAQPSYSSHAAAYSGHGQAYSPPVAAAHPSYTGHAASPYGYSLAATAAPPSGYAGYSQSRHFGYTSQAPSVPTGYSGHSGYSAPPRSYSLVETSYPQGAYHG